MGNSCFTSQPEVVSSKTSGNKSKKKSKNDSKKDVGTRKNKNKHISNTGRNALEQLSSPMQNTTIASTLGSSSNTGQPQLVPDKSPPPAEISNSIHINAGYLHSAGSQNNSKASAQTKAFMGSGGDHPYAIPPSSISPEQNKGMGLSADRPEKNASSLSISNLYVTNNNQINIVTPQPNPYSHSNPNTQPSSSTGDGPMNSHNTIGHSSDVGVPSYPPHANYGHGAGQWITQPSVNTSPSGNVYPSSRSSFHSPSQPLIGGEQHPPPSAITSTYTLDSAFQHQISLHSNVNQVDSEGSHHSNNKIIGSSVGGNLKNSPNQTVITTTPLPQLPKYNPRAIRKSGSTTSATTPTIGIYNKNSEHDGNMLLISNQGGGGTQINNNNTISNPFLPPSSYTTHQATVHFGAISSGNGAPGGGNNEDSYGPSPLGPRALQHSTNGLVNGYFGTSPAANYSGGASAAAPSPTASTKAHHSPSYPSDTPMASTSTHPHSSPSAPAGHLRGGRQPLPLAGQPSTSPSNSLNNTHNGLNSNNGLPPLPPPLAINTQLNSLSIVAGQKSNSPTTTTVTTAAGLSFSNRINPSSNGSNVTLTNNMTNGSNQTKPSPSGKGLFGRAYSTDSNVTAAENSQRTTSNSAWVTSGLWGPGGTASAGGGGGNQTENGSLVSFATVGRNATLYGSHYGGGNGAATGNDNASVAGSMSIFGGQYPKSIGGDTDGVNSQFGGKISNKKLNFTDDKNDDDDDDELARSFASSTKSGTSSIGSARNAINRNEEDAIYNDRRVSDVASRISRDPTSQISALGAAARATDEFLQQQQRRQAEAWMLAEQMQAEFDEEDLRSQATGSQVDSVYREQQQQKQRMLLQQAQQNALTIDQQERLLIQRNALLMAQQEAIEEQLVIDFIVGEPKESGTAAGSGVSRQLSSASSIHRDKMGLVVQTHSSPSSTLLGAKPGGGSGGSGGSVVRFGGQPGSTTTAKESFGGLFGNNNNTISNNNQLNSSVGGSMANSFTDRPQLLPFSPPPPPVIGGVPGGGKRFAASPHQLPQTATQQSPNQHAPNGPLNQMPVKMLFGSGHNTSSKTSSKNSNQTPTTIGQVLTDGSPTTPSNLRGTSPSSRGTGALSPPSGSSSSRNPASRRVQASSPATSLPFNLPPNANVGSSAGRGGGANSNMLMVNSAGSPNEVVVPQAAW